MHRIQEYLKRYMDSVLVDLTSSLVSGCIVMWLVDYNLPFFGDENIPFKTKVVILGIVFIITNIISILIKTSPKRHKFRFHSIDAVEEYKGDSIRVHTKYWLYSNGWYATQLYTRRDYYAQEDFALISKTPGFEVKELGHDGTRHEYIITFPKIYFFWEKIQFELEFSGSNYTRAHENYYQIDIIDPTTSVSIDVHMDQDLCTDEIRLRAFLDHTTAEAQSEKVPYNGAYKWSIPDVKLGWSYRYEWNWSELEKKIIEERRKVKQSIM